MDSIDFGLGAEDNIRTQFVRIKSPLKGPPERPSTKLEDSSNTDL
jgi:hypothetical protein